MDEGDLIILQAGGARAEVSAEHGGRLASLSFDDHELLVTKDEAAERLGQDPPPPTQWGMFVMAPWAGRIRHGRFDFDGREHQLPINKPPHAIHGTLLDRPCDRRDVNNTAATLSWSLTEPWPFAGSVSHTVELREDSITLTLEVHADDAMPVTVGWHPWWRLDIDTGRSLELDFKPKAMYQRDQQSIPTGELVDPTPGPWDDCFPRPSEPIRLVWPDAVTLRLETSAADVVVFTQPEHARCVEPQTGPPDAVNLGSSAKLEAGQSLVAVSRWIREA